jgi:hypothetical protein
MSKKIEKLKVAKKGDVLVWNDVIRKINEIIEVVNKDYDKKNKRTTTKKNN